MSANLDPQYVIDPNAPPPEQQQEQAPDPAALQAQLDELNRRVEHEARLREVAEQQSAFWYDAASKKLEAQQQQEPQQQQQFSAPVAAPELTEDLYNQILSNPAEMAKYVDEVAEYKARTISHQVASTVADEKANQITGDQRRLQSAWAGEVRRMREAGVNTFGSAGDPITDLFAQKVTQMMQDPSYANLDPVIAMRLAIREAESDYLRSGGVMQQQQQGQQQEEQSPIPQFPRTLTQQQRNAAIAAQAPNKGRRAAPPEKFSNIPPDQMAMLQKHAAGLGVPVEKIIEQMPRVVKFRG